MNPYDASTSRTTSMTTLLTFSGLSLLGILAGMGLLETLDHMHRSGRARLAALDRQWAALSKAEDLRLDLVLHKMTVNAADGSPGVSPMDVALIGRLYPCLPA